LPKVNDYSKEKKEWEWIDLRHDEVDSHFFPKEEGLKT
jgi:hypothetical protein